MFSLVNKTALVTGAGSGIGEAISRRLAKAGALVIIADLKPSQAIADSINGHYLEVDVSDPQSVKALFDKAKDLVGPLDIVINNAGINGQDGVTFEESDNDLTRKIFEINTFGVIYGLKYGPAAMRDGGSIINTASLGGSFMFPGSGPYSASKAAVINASQMAAMELSARKIRVNAVAPSFINTPMAQDDRPLFDKIAKITTCAERIAEPEDVAAVYHFLASDDSCYVNAQVINVDAGMSVGLTNNELTLILDS